MAAHKSIPEIDVAVIVRDERWRTVSGVEDVCCEAARAAYDAVESEYDTQAEASIVLADDTFVAELNREYRDRDGPTNVLSFAAMDDEDVAMQPDMPVMLGDIIVAQQTTAGEADNMGIALESHLRHLVVHGMLHLLGYDHETDDDAAVMEPMETSILATLGVADPYAGEAGAILD